MYVKNRYLTPHYINNDHIFTVNVDSQTCQLDIGQI